MREIESNVKHSTSIKKANKKNNHQNNTAIKLKNGGGLKKGSLKLSTPELNNSMTSTKTTTNKMGSNHSSSKNSSKSNSPKKGKAGSNKKSEELRPRRRASQTYFFKYQLARNPLKAEEEDLKLALLASLQQCNNNNNNKSNSCNKNNKKNNKSKQSNKTGKRLSTIDKAKKGKKITKINIASKKSRSSNSSSGSSTSTINSPYSDSNKSKEDISEELASSVSSTSTTPEPNESSVHFINKPETEDFLSFICLRSTAPENFNNDTSSNTVIYATPNKTSIKNEFNNNLKCNINNCGSTKFFNNNNHSPITNIYNRRPVRQSPRLANSHKRKISENNDSSNTIITSTAYDNSITYEEDLKRVSIALEDMAQEINYPSETNNKEVAKKHLVKGLMTREFAGAFADEETIFESISNHKI